jgi:AcrR family transcriptional regulator
VILEVALRILRLEGLEAVTMRRLATELDTGPASLYVYFSGRQELRDAMLDRASELIELEEPDPARWREQLHRLVNSVLEMLEAHPGLAEVAVANPPTGERSMRFAENLLALLRAGGVADRDAAWAIDILPLITTASAVETVVHQRRMAEQGGSWQDTAERLGRVFEALPPEEFPNLSELRRELTSGDGDARFTFAVDVFLDGLVARSGRS